jgi:CDP-glycerol glycerophosphotransferase
MSSARLSDTLRSYFESVSRWTLRAGLGVTRWLLPKRNHAVIYGVPVLEGNAVEIVRALLKHYNGKIFWLDGPGWAGALKTLGLDSPRVHVARKFSLRAMAAYSTAELVFFTHGLYGGPPSPRHKTIVNLWHGDGIKAKPHIRPKLLTADYVVGSTKLLTALKARDFVTPSQLVTGNPRNDAFFDESARSRVEDLLSGTNGRPYICWLPTFRIARTVGFSRGWIDGDGDLTRVEEGGTVLAEKCARRGFSLVLKPHPLDASLAGLSDSCAVVINDELLNKHALSVNNLLAYSAGLVTDFSSAWTDYLLLDRPIGFYAEDADRYREARGVQPADILEWLPGRWLNREKDFRWFLDDVECGGDLSAAMRQRSRDHLGMVGGRDFSERLLVVLRERDAFS